MWQTWWQLSTPLKRFCRDHSHSQLCSNPLRLCRGGAKTMLKHIFAVAVLFLLCSGTARAACTGSATTWSCAAGSASSDISSAINSASDGATITFAAGSYSLSGVYFSLSKGATLICATSPQAVGAATTNPCTISTSGTAFGTTAYSPNNTHLYRISGFTFSSSGVPIWFCSQGGCTGSFSQIRIDHNTFNLSGSAGIIFGDSSSVVTQAGVVDHNLFTSGGSLLYLELLGTFNPSTANPPLAKSNNLFVENNTMTTTTLTDAGSGCIDGWSSAFSVVFRYNTVTNCRILSHGVPHGGGPANFEVYGNTIIMNSGSMNAGEGGCYRCVHDQGANTMMVFNNVLTAVTKDSDPMAFLHYRDDGTGPSDSAGDVPPACDGTVSGKAWPGTTSTFSDGNRSPASVWYGYPCFRQPGRDISGAYKPIYAWNNSWSDTGAIVPLAYDDAWSGIAPPGCAAGASGNCDYSSVHVLPNREYYNAVSASAQTSAVTPFNGLTGMGFGLLANRPTTCVTSTESALGNGAAGVGYFATDVGSQGTLYTCSATNTWTVYYTPYTYPHPLVSGGGSTGPAPPTNLAATVH